MSTYCSIASDINLYLAIRKDWSALSPGERNCVGVAQLLIFAGDDAAAPRHKMVHVLRVDVSVPTLAHPASPWAHAHFGKLQ
jgi:hypothetical protein